MPKKRTQKRKRIHKTPNYTNQALKTVNTGIKAATAITALGITTNALTTITKT